MAPPSLFEKLALLVCALGHSTCYRQIYEGQGESQARRRAAPRGQRSVSAYLMVEYHEMRVRRGYMWVYSQRLGQPYICDLHCE